MFRVFERVFLPLEIETKTHLFSSSKKKKTEKALARVAEEVERDLELVGVTAIEDKLADGVPAAVASLVRGGVKVIFYLFPSLVLLGLLSFLFSFSPFGLEKKNSLKGLDDHGRQAGDRCQYRRRLPAAPRPWKAAAVQRAGGRGGRGRREAGGAAGGDGAVGGRRREEEEAYLYRCWLELFFFFFGRSRRHRHRRRCCCFEQQRRCSLPIGRHHAPRADLHGDDSR